MARSGPRVRTRWRKWRGLAWVFGVVLSAIVLLGAIVAMRSQHVPMQYMHRTQYHSRMHVVRTPAGFHALDAARADWGKSTLDSYESDAPTLWQVVLDMDFGAEQPWATTAVLIIRTIRFEPKTGLSATDPRRELSDVDALAMRRVVMPGLLEEKMIGRPEENVLDLPECAEALIAHGTAIIRDPVESGSWINLAGAASLVGLVVCLIGLRLHQWSIAPAWSTTTTWACSTCEYDARTIGEGQVACPQCQGAFALRDLGENAAPLLAVPQRHRSGDAPTWAWVWGGCRRSRTLGCIGACVFTIAMIAMVAWPQQFPAQRHGIGATIVGMLTQRRMGNFVFPGRSCCVYVKPDGTLGVNPTLPEYYSSALRYDVQLVEYEYPIGAWGATALVRHAEAKVEQSPSNPSHVALTVQQEQDIRRTAIDDLASKGLLRYAPSAGGLINAGTWTGPTTRWIGWIVNALTVLAAIVWARFELAVWNDRRRIRRIRHGKCPTCAYDLRGQPAGAARCPECGDSLIRKGAGGKPLLLEGGGAGETSPAAQS